MTTKVDLLNLYLYTMIYRNMKSVKDLGTLTEKWRQFYYFNFNYNEHLEMIIDLHIRLFLMSYDSGGMNLRDSEINSGFFWQNWFLIELFIWCFMYWVLFPILKDSLSDNAMFH